MPMVGWAMPTLQHPKINDTDYYLQHARRPIWFRFSQRRYSKQILAKNASIRSSKASNLYIFKYKAPVVIPNSNYYR